MAFYLTFFVFLMLTFFDILHYELPLVVYVTGSFDVIIILGIILKMIRLGTQINDHFNVHKGVLLKIKRTLWEALNDYDGLMKRQYATHSSFKIYTEMLKALQLKHCDSNKYILDTIALLELIIQELDYDKETRPLKLMGLKCSDDLMNSIYTGIASAAFALSQLLYSKFQD
jgi:hypothetical protein